MRYGWRDVARCEMSILLFVPEPAYKQNGYYNDLLFPGEMIFMKSGVVKINFGAADSLECLATV